MSEQLAAELVKRFASLENQENLGNSLARSS